MKLRLQTFLVATLLLVIPLSLSGLVLAGREAEKALPQNPIFEAAGPTPLHPYEGLTPQEKALVARKESMFQRWLKEREERKGEMGVLYSNHKWLTIPLNEQETWYWCGPACARMVLGYLWKTTFIPTQSYLAGPWNPTNAQYGMETTSTEGTYVWKLARTLNALDGNTVPDWWVWSSYNANGDGSQIMNRLGHNVGSYNLPVVNRVLTAPDKEAGLNLTGFVGNYGHYIVTHGYLVYYHQPAPPDQIYYSNSYEDPLNGQETSLGQFWIKKDILLYCNTFYGGGWIIW